jgi:phospholipase D-like protein
MMDSRMIEQHRRVLGQVTSAAVAVLLAASCTAGEADRELSSRAQAATSPDSIQVFHTTPVNDFATADSSSTIGPIEAGIIQSFDNAVGSLDIAIFELTRQNMIDAILRAKARGVTVRMVTECENRKGEDQAFFDQLASAGIPIVDDNSSFNGEVPVCPDSAGGEMHNKFAIIDGLTVWTGSVNYTSTAFNYNREHAVKVISASVAGQYEAQFTTMFGNGLPLTAGGTGRFSRAKLTSGTTSNIVTHTVNGITVQTAFSPTGFNNTFTSTKPSGPDTMKLLRTAIFSTNSSLGFAIFFLTHSQIRSDIVARKTMSKGVIDSVGAMDSNSEFGALCGGGVSAKNENFPGKVHHKLLVVDAGTTSDPQVVVGSPNWTSSGFGFNDENMLLIHDAAIAQAAKLEVDTLYNDPANTGMECVGHLAEGFNANSPRDTQGRVAVCNDGLDNDFNSLTDGADPECSAPFPSCKVGGALCTVGADCCSGTCFNGNPRTCK